MKKTNRKDLIVLTTVFFWILIVNIGSALMGLVGWPMFFVPIFFFIQGADKGKIPSIFIGATLGLLSSYFLVVGLHFLTPSIGLVLSFVIMITIILAMIIIGGAVFPIACNNVAFAYLTANTINLEGVSFSSTVTNILVLLIGGGIMLGGAIGASEIGKRITNVSR